MQNTWTLECGNCAVWQCFYLPGILVYRGRRITETRFVELWVVSDRKRYHMVLRRLQVRMEALSVVLGDYKSFDSFSFLRPSAYLIIFSGNHIDWTRNVALIDHIIV